MSKIRGESQEKGKGFTIVELLVVTLVFSILAFVVTQSLVTSLRTSTKSASLVDVRENVENALAVMERNLRNAQGVVTCNATLIEYYDNEGQLRYFECTTSGGISYIASSSATVRLTNTDVNISCAGIFTCTQNALLNYDSVSIVLTGETAGISGAESAQVIGRTIISIRNPD